MDLGSTGLDVVEVPPGQEVDASQSGGSGDVAELRPGVGVDRVVLQGERQP
jgi:hypothetical protein